jgi:glucose/arabinose dehydrogenase
MKRYLVAYLLAAVLVVACKKDDHDNDPPVALQTRVVNSSLNFPWEIIWGPDNFIWMTEREGRISRVNPQTGEVLPVFTVPDVKTTTNYNGLLGMALHPDFSTTPQVFVVYNYDKEGAYLEKVVRYNYNGTTLTDPLVLVDDIVGKIGGEFIHNGSRLVINSDRKLFITTGDANDSSFPQSPLSKNGKVLRVNLDGTIPADNPIDGNPVWTTGHRNSQGMVYAEGKLYASEHGETTDDEINIIEKGRNYGWRIVHGLCDKPNEMGFCDSNNVKEPIRVWTPTVAPSGIDYYTKDSIPQFKNALLITTLKGERLIVHKLSGHQPAQSEFFQGEFGRLRDVCISPDGKVYISTDNGENKDMIVEVSRQH